MPGQPGPVGAVLQLAGRRLGGALHGLQLCDPPVDTLPGGAPLCDMEPAQPLEASIICMRSAAVAVWHGACIAAAVRVVCEETCLLMCMLAACIHQQCTSACTRVLCTLVPPRAYTELRAVCTPCMLTKGVHAAVADQGLHDREHHRTVVLCAHGELHAGVHPAGGAPRPGPSVRQPVLRLGRSHRGAAHPQHHGVVRPCWLHAW